MEKKQKEERGFTTLDAYLSGYLVLRGLRPRLVTSGRKIVFVFEESSELESAISDYHSGDQVEAYRLAFATKSLKGRIHSMRREKGESLDKEAVQGTAGQGQ